MIITTDLDHYPQKLENSNPQESKRVYLVNSWFDYTKTDTNFGKAGQHTIIQVMTTHARFPKKFLEKKMKYYPSGTWIILDGHVEHDDED